MKKFTMFSSVLASALMLVVASCSSSDDITGGNGNAEGSTSYLVINLNSVGNAPASRAYEQGGGLYDNGETLENQIKKVRFYFYNADGTAYKLQNTGTNGGDQNWIDQTITSTETGDQSVTVSGKTQAVLVLSGESNVSPASMLAVVNPDVGSSQLNGTMVSRWSKMRTELTGKTFHDESGFVMTNSTYEDGGKDLCTTLLSGRTYSTRDKALANPVDVYVERINAKVKAFIDLDNANFVKVTTDETVDGVNFNGKYKTKEKVGDLTVTKPNGSPQDIPVFAYIEAWGVADENDQSTYYKQIDVQNWTDATLGFDGTGTPWSSRDYHRCFWSKGVAFGGTDPVHNPTNHPFSEYKANLGDALYTLPNTPTNYLGTTGKAYDDPMKSELTKFLVTARLAYDDGSGNILPAEICTYKGQKFLGQENVKKVIADEFGTYYKMKTSDPVPTYEKIEPTDIEFSTTTDGGSLKLQDYQVVAKLKNITDLYRMSGGSYVPVNMADVKNELQAVPVEIHNGGRTYYYTPIKHLGKPKSIAEYGIVRNHSYQVELASIKGFGTPVYDPDKKIVPVVPSDDLTYLAARINVLSWRVVPSKVNLDATE
ncbi:Mfa1 family fimbria major subunit [Prevotella sp. LCP21S3_D2]|uniref:Mfa1 family fimbria major subunit n=1 Tax=Prevotella sp. LCP21S3_D2 TaxID=3438800 RepID=UPI003F99D74F